MIELPEDIAEEQATDFKPLPKSIARRPSAEPKAVRAAVEAIEKAKNPILVIGAGANRKMAGRMLEQLVEKTGMPMPRVFVIPERNPNAFATGRNPKHAAVAATLDLDLLCH